MEQKKKRKIHQSGADFLADLTCLDDDLLPPETRLQVRNLPKGHRWTEYFFSLSGTTRFDKDHLLASQWPVSAHGPGSWWRGVANSQMHCSLPAGWPALEILIFSDVHGGDFSFIYLSVFLNNKVEPGSRFVWRCINRSMRVPHSVRSLFTGDGWIGWLLYLFCVPRRVALLYNNNNNNGRDDLCIELSVELFQQFNFGGRVPEFPGSRISVFQISRVSEFQSSSVPEFRGSRVPGFQSSRVLDFPGSRVPGFQSFSVPDFPGSRVPEFQSFRVPEFQSSRVSEFQSCSVPDTTHWFLAVDAVPIVPVAGMETVKPTVPGWCSRNDNMAANPPKNTSTLVINDPPSQ